MARRASLLLILRLAGAVREAVAWQAPGGAVFIRPAHGGLLRQRRLGDGPGAGGCDGGGVSDFWARDQIDFGCPPLECRDSSAAAADADAPANRGRLGEVFLPPAANRRPWRRWTEVSFQTLNEIEETISSSIWKTHT